MRESVNFDHIKNHYYTSHPALNCYSVVPRGNTAIWDTPHDRNRAFSP
jgi:putative glutathione S-transferase